MHYPRRIGGLQNGEEAIGFMTPTVLGTNHHIIFNFSVHISMPHRMMSF